MSSPVLKLSLGLASNNNINTPPKSLASHNDYKSNALPNKFLCQVCNDPTLYCCNDCKTVFYCTPEHQIQHWTSTHQFECKGPDPFQLTQPSQTLQSPPIIRGISRIDESPRKSPVLDRDRGSVRDGFFEEMKRKELFRKTTERSSENKITISTPKQREPTANKRSTPPPREKDERVFVVKEGLEPPEYNSNMEPQENPGPVKSKLKRERVRKLKEVLKYYMQGQYDEATIKAKRLFEVSREIFETEEDADVYEVLADGLFLVKCLLPEGNITLAREYLMELWEIATHFVSDQRIDFKDDNANIKKLGYAHLRKGAANFIERDALSLARKREINQQIQKITNLYGTFGALFHEVGDFRSCEASYVKYLKVVENNFGAESLEISNCYYLLGVFYIEQKYHTKAMACLKKALKTRLKKFEEKPHETIADCYYNMAVIYKQTGRDLKAINSLNTALKMRISLVGEFSLPVAQALELAGKISLDQEDYKAALSKLQSCLNIRTRILHDPINEDITRVKLLLQDLVHSVQEKLSNDKTSFVKKENLRLIMSEIQAKNLQQEFRIPSLDIQKSRNSSAKPSIRLDTKSEEEEGNRTPKIRINTSSIRQDSKEYASAYPSKSEISESRPVIRSPTITFSPPKVVITSPNNISRLNLQSELKPVMTPKSDRNTVTLAQIDLPKSPKLTTQIQDRNILKPPEEEFVDRSKRFTFGKGDDMETANAYAKSRKSLGQSAKPQTPTNRPKTKRLNLPEDFLDSLTGGQLTLLNELNLALRGNTGEKMDSLVAQSDFYRSLLTPQKSEFIKLNPELVM